MRGLPSARERCRALALDPKSKGGGWALKLGVLGAGGGGEGGRGGRGRPGAWFPERVGSGFKAGRGAGSHSSIQEDWKN